MKVLVGVGWDKREFLEPNLHVYGRDNTRIIVYSIEDWPKGKEEEKNRKKNQEIFVIIL